MVAAAIRTTFAQPPARWSATRSRPSHDEWQVAERRILSEESMPQLTPPAPTAITATSTKTEVINTDMIRTA